MIELESETGQAPSI